MSGCFFLKHGVEDDCIGLAPQWPCFTDPPQGPTSWVPRGPRHELF